MLCARLHRCASKRYFLGMSLVTVEIRGETNNLNHLPLGGTEPQLAPRGNPAQVYLSSGLSVLRDQGSNPSANSGHRVNNETSSRWDGMQIQPLATTNLKSFNVIYCSKNSFKRSPRPCNSGSTADNQHRSGGQTGSYRQKHFKEPLKILSIFNSILETN